MSGPAGTASQRPLQGCLRTLKKRLSKYKNNSSFSLLPSIILNDDRNAVTKINSSAGLFNEHLPAAQFI
jgi:hypothetical protein